MWARAGHIPLRKADSNGSNTPLSHENAQPTVSAAAQARVCAGPRLCCPNPHQPAAKPQAPASAGNKTSQGIQACRDGQRPLGRAIGRVRRGMDESANRKEVANLKPLHRVHALYALPMGCRA